MHGGKSGGTKKKIGFFDLAKDMAHDSGKNFDSTFNKSTPMSRSRLLKDVSHHSTAANAIPKVRAEVCSAHIGFGCCRAFRQHAASTSSGTLRSFTELCTIRQSPCFDRWFGTSSDQWLHFLTVADGARMVAHDTNPRLELGL